MFYSIEIIILRHYMYTNKRSNLCVYVLWLTRSTKRSRLCPHFMHKVGLMYCVLNESHIFTMKKSGLYKQYKTSKLIGD